MEGFEKFNLKSEVLTTLNKLRFSKPTEIQNKVIPLALNHKNVIGKSETGSGKTHAFLLPILNNIDINYHQVQAVILAPTRELAIQIFQMALPFCDSLEGLKIKLLSGGLDRAKMIDSVEESPHIVIGTPGRVVDLAFTKALFNITSAKTIVLDEADMILENGFFDEVGLILSKAKKDTQILTFSATMDNKLIHELKVYMDDPKFIDLNKNKTNGKVAHIAYPTRNKNRLDVLYELMNNINPYLCIIFASRKETVDDIYKFLREKGENVGIIHGDLDATTRRVMMKRIRNNDFRYIVASDIAARGIDIEGVSHIINYDLPYEQEFYFHRSGRTGRASFDGDCYSLYSKDEIKYLERLHKLGVNFENKEFQNGKIVNLKPLFKTHVKSNKKHPEYAKIQRIINESKKGKVKPGYKKKRDAAIEKVKQKYHREMIKNDIKKQIRDRAIKKTKAEKEKMGDYYE